MTTHVLDGTPEQAVGDIRETARFPDLAAQGHLLRLCRPKLRNGWPAASPSGAQAGFAANHSRRSRHHDPHRHGRLGGLSGSTLLAQQGEPARILVRDPEKAAALALTGAGRRG
jgi:hypothetical protein